MKNTAATPQRTGRNIKTPGAVSRKDWSANRVPAAPPATLVRPLDQAGPAGGPRCWRELHGNQEVVSGRVRDGIGFHRKFPFSAGLLVEPAPALSRWDSCPSWLSQNTPSGSGAGQLDKPTSARLPAAGTAQVLAFRQRPLTTRRNYFYGNKFDHAMFVYRGGQVHCGTNNSVVDSKPHN
jgi:hypothetical protein